MALEVPGIADLRGCPDGDADGLADLDDKRPAQAEDVDGFEDGDGCPEPDNDKDGVSDMADACPLDRGSTENKGCPDTDRDGDTVGDRLDNCPAEIGPPEHQGCPRKQLVKITEDKSSPRRRRRGTPASLQVRQSAAAASSALRQVAELGVLGVPTVKYSGHYRRLWQE